MSTAAKSGASVLGDLIANILGRAWAFISIFLFVPAYVHLIGLEKFGVIALFLAVGGLIAVLDLGLSPTIARELHDQERSRDEKVNLLFTYEVAYAALIGVIVFSALLAPKPVFSLFVSADDLANPEVAVSLRLVFAAAALQLLQGFYIAGLMGIEEQVKGNLVIIGAGLVRNGVVVVPLWFYPEPSLFLLWQTIFILLFAVIARHLLYKSLVSDMQGWSRVFDIRFLSDNLHFTRSMFLIAAASAVVMQIDKLFISKIHGIATLAEYSLVWTFSRILVFVISPITITLLPRFVKSASSSETLVVRELFFVAHRLVAAVVCAAVGSMVFFGPYLIHIWTAGELSPDVASQVMIPLIIGHALLALQTVPYSVAVANKDMSRALTLGIACALFALPMYWLLINHLGSIGAALTWLVLQACVYPLYLHWVNRRFVQLPSIWRDFLMPTLLPTLSIALLINYIASKLVSSVSSIAVNLLVILVAAALSTLSCLFCTLRRRHISYLLSPVR